MGIFSGCLLACDIDGTLIASGYINPRNLEKIEFFMQEGGCFSLATGRTVGAVSPVLEQIRRVSPSVLSNGCMIYDYENRRMLDELFLPQADYAVAKRVAESGLPVGIEIHSRDKVLVLRASREGEEHIAYERLNAFPVDFREACGYRWNKVLYLFDDETVIPEVKSLIAAQNSTSDFLDTSAVIGGRERHYYEQFPKGVSKAFALDKLRKMLKIDKGCLFAMGDYYNDLEMIQKADVSAVPAEAPDDVKAYADFVACACRDGAVADFIDYLTEKRKE